MSNERPVRLTDTILAAQSEASDPAHNIWVSANAGSGKTFVLTRRVLRILLTGVAPENVLCLTYTKAAAAEMQRRVADELGNWATAPDDALRKTLRDLMDRDPDGATLVRARSLFAKALETPGGLKIKTIHAFCEAALHRFPLEAEIPVRFSVIEEAEKERLLDAAREQVLAAGLAGDNQISGAVTALFELLTDDKIKKTVDAALGHRELKSLLNEEAAILRHLESMLGAWDKSILTEFAQRVVSETLLDEDVLADVAAAFAKPGAFAEKLAAFDWQGRTEKTLLSLFFTIEMNPAKKLLNKGEAEARPDLAELLKDEQNRLTELVDGYKRSRTFAVSEALLMVVRAIHQRYEADKKQRALLDFDDLIERLIHLLSDQPSRDWVRYKLDAEISHILVDESQDTNPDQWRTVQLLIDEFFAGDGIARAPRTIFAVGDEKQSIYSFQGADPTLFAEVFEKTRERAVQVQSTVKEVRLSTSFRTQINILKGVDLVAEDERFFAGMVVNKKVEHQSAREAFGGRITLWPLLEKSKKEKDDPAEPSWPAELAPSDPSPDLILAERIVGEIAHWLKVGRPLKARNNRPVRADDILILVQSRSTIYQAIIRGLKEQGIPTPGADRLSVTEHIFVLDMLALADIVLNPDDNLALAALLKSPLFGLTEDQLATLSTDRKGVSLWHRLEEAASEEAASEEAASEEAASGEGWAKAVLEELEHLRRVADLHRPHEFYASLLYGRGALKRFHARLGSEIDDVVLEFLDLALAQEQSDTPSLIGFVTALRDAKIAVKREMGEGGGVRVMTVHGAKGLEAPIVILADAHKTPTSKFALHAGMSPEPHFVVHFGKSERPQEVDEELVDGAIVANEQEYWRLLYVGMTRAEDELHVAATDVAKNPSITPWYTLIERQLGADLVPHAMSSVEGADFRSYPDAPHPFNGGVQAAAQSANEPIMLPKAPEQPLTIPALTPSTAADKSEWKGRAGDNPSDADLARRKGTALHALLQHLSDVPHAQRDIAARGALPQLLPEHPREHEGLVKKALSIFESPDASLLFGESSRAEVPLAARLKRDGAPVSMTGRIDRLVVNEDQVLIVDFKSDAVPPAAADQVGSAYLTQLGLYRLALSQLFVHHQINAALYWTQTESLMVLPSEQLDKAVARYTLS